MPGPGPNRGPSSSEGSGGGGGGGSGNSSPAAMVDWAKSQVGVTEGSSRQILYAREVGYSPSLPWCSIFIAFGLKTVCGITPPGDAAYSGAWLQWGGGSKVNTNDIQAGDLAIFDWGDGGITDHIALAIGDGQRIGGNESNAVSQSPLDAGNIVGVVRPDYANPDAAPTGPGAGTGFTEEDLFAITRAAAFSTELEVPGLTEEFSRLFKGDKSIYNDQPLFPFIEQICQGSFRHFQSLPNGAFFAFFPDYFGAYGHRKPYWNIDDLEIIDGQMGLTDDALATHVFVAGDLNWSGTVDMQEMINSKGVITVFDAFNSDKTLDKDRDKQQEKEAQKVGGDSKFVHLEGRMDAMQFLKRYGVRPHIEQPTFIRNPFFEVFYAYMTFQLLWSKQFLQTFTFTFMPELYPGGIVAFEDYGFQCYIESVTHSFDYESGFTTQANLMAPAALGEKNDTAFSQGMIRRMPKDAEHKKKVA